MRSFRSSLFASPLAALLSITMVTGALSSLTGCSSATASSERVGDDSLSAALSSDDPSTVRIVDGSGKVVASQTVSTEGLSITADADGLPLFNFADGSTFKMLEAFDLGDGIKRVTMLSPQGDRIVFNANTTGQGSGGLAPQAIHAAVAIALIGALVVVTVALITFWSQGRCLDYLLASQRLCPGNHPGGNGQPVPNWSGSCTGGSWKDGWQYTATATCTAGDPRPVTPVADAPAAPPPPVQPAPPGPAH